MPRKCAILSRICAKEEVTFQDMQDDLPIDKKDFCKLQNSCRLAHSQGSNYIWVDTCCIDKTSSAELSKAINSTYRWYQEADICYAYLSDVPNYSGPDTQSNQEYNMRQSRWYQSSLESKDFKNIAGRANILSLTLQSRTANLPWCFLLVCPR